MSVNASRENVFIDVDNRVFYLHDYINQDSISKICFSLLGILRFDDEKEEKEKNFVRKPIKFYINSRGGYLDDMWSLVDIMIGSKTQIDTYCTGYAISCGFFIFLAGKNRFMTDHAYLLCHQFSGGIIGTYQDMIEGMEEYHNVWKSFEDYICSRTKVKSERLNEMRERKIDWIMRSNEALKLGVATDTINKF